MMGAVTDENPEPQAPAVRQAAWMMQLVQRYPLLAVVLAVFMAGGGSGVTALLTGGTAVDEELERDLAEARADIAGGAAALAACVEQLEVTRDEAKECLREIIACYAEE